MKVRPWFYSATQLSKCYHLVAEFSFSFSPQHTNVNFLSKFDVSPIFAGLYHPAGACVNLSERVVHLSWTAMGIPGPKFCAVISIPQTISCVSHLLPTALLKQEDREVTNLFYKYGKCVDPKQQNVMITDLSVSVPQASCQDCVLEEASSSKDTLEAFCRSDFGRHPFTSNFVLQFSKFFCPHICFCLSHSSRSCKTASYTSEVQPYDPVPVFSWFQTGDTETRTPFRRADSFSDWIVAGEGCQLCKEHHAATPTRRHLPSNGDCSGGTPGGH